MFSQWRLLAHCPHRDILNCCLQWHSQKIRLVHIFYPGCIFKWQPTCQRGISFSADLPRLGWGQERDVSSMTGDTKGAPETFTVFQAPCDINVMCLTSSCKPKIILHKSTGRWVCTFYYSFSPFFGPKPNKWFLSYPKWNFSSSVIRLGSSFMGGFRLGEKPYGTTINTAMKVLFIGLLFLTWNILYDE